MRATPMANDQDESLLPHLEELRRRLARCILATFISVTVGIMLAFRIVGMIAESANECGLVLETESPTEFLGTVIRVSLLVGSVIATPVWIYNAFQFARPGLEPHERRLALLAIVILDIAFAAFGLGAAVGLTYALPFVIRALEDMRVPGIKHGWQLKPYLRFVLRFAWAVGLFANLPLVVFVLGRLGLKTSMAKRLLIATAIIGVVVGGDYLLAMGNLAVIFALLSLFIILGPLRILRPLRHAGRYLNELKSDSRSFVSELIAEAEREEKAALE